LRAELEANNRQLKWEKWYKDHPILQWLVRPFWWMSDYGRSTSRVILTFFEIALVFGLLYCCNEAWINNLWQSDFYTSGSFIELFFRSLYFSVVTMTTVGVGDIQFAAGSTIGSLLVMAQVLMGYTMLAALVSRLAVLFQEG